MCSEMLAFGAYRRLGGLPLTMPQAPLVLALREWALVYAFAVAWRGTTNKISKKVSTATTVIP